MQALAGCGSRVSGLSQDDFGKGYSSYINLVSTPFTELKIDRALVRGCNENEELAQALTSIVGLGRQLGLTVVAEGVETAQELALFTQDRLHSGPGIFDLSRCFSDLFQQLLVHDGPASAF